MAKSILSTSCLVILAVLVSMAVAGQAQQPAQSPSTKQASDAEVQEYRAKLRDQRRKTVAANVPLTEAEAAKFWPVYDQYIAETVKINDGRYALIQEYAKNYESLTDDQADSFIQQWVAFDRDDTDLRLRYIPEFQKVISHRKTAMFFQVDRRVAMMVNLQLAGQVPLVKPE